ncbi:MAG: tetratricopeptide repeat protein [Deltaproteobacteria bacterium]|nr:tetratricopeptide repeat protein [Deltaproteobacteria bacterium]
MQKEITNYELRITNLKSKIVNLKSQILLLLAVYCILLTVFTGCASTKKSELPKVQIEAVEYNQRGVDAVAAGSYDKALIEFQKSLRLNTSIDNQKGIAVNLLNLGRLYLLMNRFDDASVVFDRAIKTGSSLNDQIILSEGYASMGRYYYLTGNNKDAIDVLEKALNIDRKEGYHGIGSRLNIMGMLYMDSNRLEDAEKVFGEALKLNKDYGMEADTADSFRGLGDVSAKKEDYKKAMELYENALVIDKKSGRGAHIAIDLYALGNVSLKENAAEKALDFFLRAYAVNLSRGDVKMALKNLDIIIEIYTRSKDKNSVEIYSSEREKVLSKEMDYKK